MVFLLLVTNRPKRNSIQFSGWLQSTPRHGAQNTNRNPLIRLWRWPWNKRWFSYERGSNCRSLSIYFFAVYWHIWWSRIHRNTNYPLALPQLLSCDKSSMDPFDLFPSLPGVRLYSAVGQALTDTAPFLTTTNYKLLSSWFIVLLGNRKQIWNSPTCTTIC